jgi:hypothetical protein
MTTNDGLLEEYLCQTPEGASCGACCGLYNVREWSFEALRDLLLLRTALYDETPGNFEAILKFRDRIVAEECPERPIEDFHHCPYIGLLGENKSRVGCLLHPLNPKNNNFDFRGLSDYGGMTCRVYFCPSSVKLLKPAARIVKILVKDWHAYGLIITETKLLNAFFEKIEESMAGFIDERIILQNPATVCAISEFLALKLKWPFRKKGHPYPANYFFNDNLCPKPKIDYQALGASVSRYDVILEELVSDFDSPAALASAENQLDDILARIKKGFHAAGRRA